MWSIFRHSRRDECGELRELLSAYIDERLSHRDRKSVELHLEECEKCREELSSLRDVIGLLHRMPPEPLPRSFAITELKPAPHPFVAEVRPAPHPTLFGALRAATVVATVCLVILFTFDIANVFPSTIPKQVQHPTPTSQVATEGRAVMTGGAEAGKEVVTSSEAGKEAQRSEVAVQATPGAAIEPQAGGVPQGMEKPGWLHSLEMTLLGVVVILSGSTIALWRWWRSRGMSRTI